MVLSLNIFAIPLGVIYQKASGEKTLYWHSSAFGLRGVYISCEGRQLQASFSCGSVFNSATSRKQTAYLTSIAV